MRFTRPGDATKDVPDYTGLSRKYAWNHSGVYTTRPRDQRVDHHPITSWLRAATQEYLKDAQGEMMITLLLVEDEPLVRHGLRTWLERDAQITVVGEASDGAEAIAQAQELQPDVVLMDIALPTMDGITAAAALRATVPHSAVVFLSLYDDADTRTRAYAAGGAAFVGKHEGVRALRSAIRQAAALQGNDRISVE